MLVQWKPFNDFINWERDLFRMFNVDKKSYWKPPVDIHEGDKLITIDVELPGLNEDDIKVSLEDYVLTIEGEHKYEEKKEGEYYKTERYQGSFKRSFTLPSSMETKNIEALFNKGVLTIKIPKRPEKVPRKITIKTKRE